MNAEDLKELIRIFPNTTPGKWKLWGNSIMADSDGTSNVATAKPVARFYAPRVWDADMCCILQRNMPDLLDDARALWAVRVLDAWQFQNPKSGYPRMRASSCCAEEVGSPARLSGDFVCRLSEGRATLSNHRGRSYDAARLAAAEAVFPELPADVRERLGVRP